MLESESNCISFQIKKNENETFKDSLYAQLNSFLA